tara:strand:- start:2334 stop:3362 length:1029 start_codon:yes stop_codon:yes gene_type:complete
MELYEREHLLSKVMLGYSRLKIKKDLTLIVRPLNAEQNFFAQEAFKEAYDDALFSGVYTRKEMLEIMTNQGVWSKQDDHELSSLQKRVEDLKVKLYDSFYVPALVKQIKEAIKATESEQSRLFEKKHSNDHLDCEGIASYSRWNWIIENTTFFEDGIPYDFSHVDPSTVLRYYHNNSIPQEKIRELARTNPWRSTWHYSKQTPKDVFNKNPSEFSSDQKQLLEWTSLYDNLAEAAESPHERIVQDDDALDGWLIKQRIKRDKEHNNERLDGLAGRHQGADEVFIMARSKEERQQIHDLNGAQGKFNVKKRMDEINKSDRPMKIEEFTDVKISTMNKAKAKFG